eukprot:TRINITY_DN1648_c0_g1_i4.p1 TRINITY_DN1648_c0_g1~~TRINITY_DN1648_c0_g1_i4.p1  ORF type:complete len:482 (+),score=96.73 TRINITY_DN1648_c0_g1_i4:75-1448(+)
MGPILTKPVTTKILERKSTKLFHIGVGFMNGYREKMEDAHTVMPIDDEGWGFFGVFDGHCGPLCSKYVADRFPKLIPNYSIPIPDDKLRDLSIQIDNEFLESGEEGGSTGTFMFATKKGDGYHLQVGNVGDSRIVLGRKKDRSEHSLTEDHKPNSDEERQRIEAAGGHVANNRVDGALAVSRAFGDKSYKSSGDFDSKVIAVPDFTHVEAESGDFVLLACDGVFESDVFTNASVIEFIFEMMETNKDLAVIAAAVCDEAMNRGSKDNISAMIVQLGGESPFEKDFKEHSIIAGRFSSPGNSKFVSAYKGMCEEAGVSVETCVEMRFDQLVSEKSRLIEQLKVNGNRCDVTLLSNDDLIQLLRSKDKIVTSREEALSMLSEMAEDPDADLRPLSLLRIEEELESWEVPEQIAQMEPGNEERVAWFANWIEYRKANTHEPDAMDLLQMAMKCQNGKREN